ncbi:MAG: DUF1330 domain-containing protein [Arcobacteraceae bacterium]
MSVYVIGQITIKNSQKWEEYKAQVPQTLESFNASVVLRGNAVESLDGNDAYTDIVVLEFDTLAEAKKWYSSSRYQTLIPLRKEAANVVLKIYEAMK